MAENTTPAPEPPAPAEGQTPEPPPNPPIVHHPHLTNIESKGMGVTPNTEVRVTDLSNTIGLEDPKAAPPATPTPPAAPAENQD
jgi:hypothetical protein